MEEDFSKKNVWLRPVDYKSIISFLVLYAISGFVTSLQSQEINTYSYNYLYQTDDWLNTELLKKDYVDELREEYKDRFFRVWDDITFTSDSRDYILSLYSRYKTPGRYFGQNHKEWENEKLNSYIDNADFSSAPTLKKNAISVYATNARLLPTIKPLFLSPDMAGEGYPFDYLQNSAIWPGTPLKIFHTSKDGAWYYCSAPFVEGWIESKDIAICDDSFVKEYKKNDIGIIKKDEISAIDNNGQFISTLYIGTAISVLNSQTGIISCLIPKRDEDGNAVIATTNIRKDQITLKNDRVYVKDFYDLVKETIGSPYGWGGAYFTRDCSALIRDIYSVFGIWLPRNSGAQIKAGKESTGLEGMSKKQKYEKIDSVAIPLLSLIYKKGHIVIYMGYHSNIMMIYHSAWGVKTSSLMNRGRYVMGGAVLTELEPGKDMPLVEETFMDSFSSFTNLVPKDDLSPEILNR
ncbi:MAG: NlpC/P60 family N-terminal domain-containing protein [Candidatus Kapaibacteriales bacterium]